MNRQRLFQHSYWSILAYCLVIAIAVMYWGGPISVGGAIAELRIGEGDRSIILSGHQFLCDWQHSRYNVTRCRTLLKRKSLEVEFTLNRPLAGPETCNIKYDGRVFTCKGFNDYRHKTGQVDLYMENSLDLTESDRWWLLLTNPLANIFGNISEIDWSNIEPIVTWVVSILISVGIWLELSRVSVLWATILSLGTLALVRPFVRWLTLLVLILTGHVD
ncbi:hypothetical protein [Microseira wollei]|uniref:Uncharacterized protein n=1 Tax=Microseira wollei NIES-4236 TaxID=2530354 RepID=A0AAV3XQ37_9CYAN|nr:hypothetical protein [Microseira wollei]GET44060.1 hypothetical protein MiSe_88860 [Microseira wollei NIES-4236]